MTNDTATCRWVQQAMLVQCGRGRWLDWVGCACKITLALRSFSDLLCITIFSIPLVVLYLLRTISCIMESYHGSLSPQNAYQMSKPYFSWILALTQHMWSCFSLRYYRISWMLYALTTALSRSAFGVPPGTSRQLGLLQMKLAYLKRLLVWSPLHS
jgi:hypothetical protein